MRIPHGLRAALAGQVAPPAPTNDPNFENVSLLLHGDGTNGAQNNTFIDGSANNFTITRTGNTTQGTFSPFSPTGWSGYFDGTGDYLTAPSNTAWEFGTGDFTVEFWVYPTSSTQGNYAGLVSAGNSLSAGNAWQIGFVGTGTTVQFQDYGAAYVTAASSIAVHQWHHVAVARSGSTIRLFVNGTQSGSASNTTNFVPSGGSLAIGFDQWLTTYANAYISNLRIVKGTAVYTSNFTPPTSPLTAITNTSLLTLQDNRFKDNSTNNFAITRNGDTRIEAFSPFNPTAAYSASTHGGSAYFDGTGDYLTTAASNENNLGTSDFTIEFWINSTKTTRSDPFGWNYSYSNAGWAGFIFNLSSSGDMAWYEQTSSRISVSATGWNNGAWNHVALTRSGNSVRMFLNGTQVGSTYTTSFSYGANTSGFIVGDITGGGGAVNGYISNLRVLKGTALYTSAFTPPTAPLTAITNTSLLLNFTNGGIIDNASKNVLETVGNAQISTSVKKFGTGSMYFDGNGDYLKGPSNSLVSLTSENFTIEGWINFIAGSNWTTVEKGLDWGLLADANRWVYKANQVNVFVINWAPSLSTWYHFACVRNGSTTTMYINGSSIGSGTSVNAASTTAPITVGYSLGFNGYALNGYIDDLRITKGVARYTANFTPPTAAFFDL